jgi:hypothetical protein
MAAASVELDLRLCEPLGREGGMEGTQAGWIAAIIIGGIAGWLAGRFMHRNIGMLMNIILGILGAANR